MARFIRLPLSKSAPRAICAFMILSVSSNKIGINRRAMDIIIATSCTGSLMTFKNPRDFSIPSVRLLGVVVSVIMDEPIISMVRRIAIKTAIRIPSLVTEIFHTENTTSPGVKNRLNTTVSISRKIMDFMPFIINLKGTLDNLITTARKTAAHTYPQILSKKNRDMINNTVPASFTRGSSLCIQESVW